MSKFSKIRLDKLLVDRCYVNTISEAQACIIAKEVKVGDVFVTSPATLVSLDEVIDLKANKRYVSRGGLKLEGALSAFNISVNGKKCLDIGSSTGGFSDCLLQHGASHVSCVDVNYGQLAWEIRQNPHVSVFERTNIKEADASLIGAPFDVIVIDVSFIGLAKLVPVIKTFTFANAPEISGCTELIALVKPQFEAKREEVKGGVVDDRNVQFRTIEEVKNALILEGFSVKGQVESPIKGASKGNSEYLVYAVI